MNDRNRLLAERRDRIIQHIKDKRTAADIAELEGIEPYYAGKLRKDIANEEGLVIEDTAASDMPIGLDKETNLFRSRLGDRLYKLRERHHPIEVARMTGVVQRAQTEAIERPFSYNWTLAQIQRLAKAEGKTFAELMKELFA